MMPHECADSTADTLAVGSKMHATFVNASTGQPTTISLRGDIIGRSADLILDNGQVVAQIKRDILNATNFFTGQDTVSWTLSALRPN